MKKFVIAILMALGIAGGACHAAVWYQNDFAGQSGYPSSYGWAYDTWTASGWGWIGNGPSGSETLGGGGRWSHPLTGSWDAGAGQVVISATILANGTTTPVWWGLSAGPISAITNPANLTGWNWSNFGPMIGFDGTNFSLQAPVATGYAQSSAAVPAGGITAYGAWSAANVILTLDTYSGLAQGYYNQVDAGHQIITNFDMRGAMSQSNFHNLFATYSDFAGALWSWQGQVDNISVTLVPEPASLGLLALGALALARRRR